MTSKFKFFNKIPWTQFLVESIVVVLSVLLALMLNTRHQDSINRELAQKAILNLKREILYNIKEVEKIIPKHKQLLDTLSSKHPPTGINSPSAEITNNAWDAAQAMGAVPYMDFSIVSVATAIQATQQQYLALVSNANAILLLANFGAGGENFQMKRIPDGLLEIVTELYSNEQKLLKQYYEALSVIGNIDSNASANRN